MRKTDNPIYKAFNDEAAEIFNSNNSGCLKIVAPNTMMELTFDELEEKFIITGCGEGYDKTKKFKSFEKAVDYMMLND